MNGCRGNINIILVWFAFLCFARPLRASDESYEKLDVFAQVLQYLQNSYVENVDSKELVYGAIRGMLETLDPHSSFMTPEQFKALRQDTSGHFGGVGIEWELRDFLLVVVDVRDDTPAKRAGIQLKDQVVKIDGKPVREMDSSKALGLLRGVPGTKVVLRIDRDSFENPKDFILVRQRIQVNSLEEKMPQKGIAYVKIHSFTERTEYFLRKSLQALRKKSHGRLQGLVLDLRNNPGGLLDQGIRVADLFIEDGLIVETKSRGHKIDQSMAHRHGTEPDYPIVCLVNSGTASASEVVVGALQDHGRALIVGEQTFGKGSIQTVLPLKDGSGLKLTTQRYYTPKHRSIQNQGIQPDVIVKRILPESDFEIKATRESDLQGHLAGDNEPEAREKPSTSDDNQLKTALDYLKAWERFGGRRTQRAERSKTLKSVTSKRGL
jgi:carboxyl-terminal processing protease